MIQRLPPLVALPGAHAHRMLWNWGKPPQPASSTWGFGPGTAQNPSHKQTLIYHLNRQTWCFDFYIMGLSSASGFLHHLSENQAALPEPSSRLRHEWMFSTFLPLRRCCISGGDDVEKPNSKAVVDPDGRRREDARWTVNATKHCLLFLPAVFHCFCQRSSFVFEVEGCVGGQSRLSPDDFSCCCTSALGIVNVRQDRLLKAEQVTVLCDWTTLTQLGAKNIKQSHMLTASLDFTANIKQYKSRRWGNRSLRIHSS